MGDQELADGSRKGDKKEDNDGGISRERQGSMSHARGISRGLMVGMG